MTTALRQALSRRDLLITTSLSAAGSLLLGCGWDRNVSPAYEPWDFDPADDRPEVVAVMGAILAANPHNTQPWLFRITPTAIDVYANPAHSLGSMDPLDRELHIGLGCAVENLVVTAVAVGRSADVTWLPTADDPSHVARIALQEAAPAPSTLFDALPLRHTNRGPYEEDEPLPGAFRSALLDLVDEPVAAKWVDDRTGMDDIALQTIAATEAIIADEEMSEDSHAWWRSDADDITEHRTGTTVDAAGLTGCGRSSGRHLANPDAERAGRYWLSATEGRQTTAAAWVLLSTPDLEDRTQQLETGRLYQRMHLLAEAEGYAMQPLNQAPEQRDRALTTGRSDPFGTWLASVVGGREVQMIFRLGVAKRPALPSPRMPVGWVTVT